MGIQCQILINKPREGVFRAGDVVAGKVKYFIDEPTEYQDVVLSCIGKGKCKWTRRSNKSSHTYIGTEKYIAHHLNIHNKRPEETITLDGGYEHPFEFYLPEDIPRSYKDIIGSISYRIKLKFEKPSFFSFNKVFTAEIPVYSYLKPPPVEGPVIFGIQKNLFSLFASQPPVVDVKIEIEKTFLTPGENARLTYLVTNDTDVEVTAVATDLHCYTTYTANCGTVRRETERVHSCEAQTTSVPEKSVSRFECILPTLPELYSIQGVVVISKEYKIKVTLRLPLPHFNESVEMPILIGETRGAAERTLEAEDHPDGAPPSYWESMNEKEKKQKGQ